LFILVVVEVQTEALILEVPEVAVLQATQEMVVKAVMSLGKVLAEMAAEVVAVLQITPTTTIHLVVAVE
jgi:hypothetical protein